MTFATVTGALSWKSSIFTLPIDVSISTTGFLSAADAGDVTANATSRNDATMISTIVISSTLLRGIAASHSSPFPRLQPCLGTDLFSPVDSGDQKDVGAKINLSPLTTSRIEPRAARTPPRAGGHAAASRRLQCRR